MSPESSKLRFLREPLLHFVLLGALVFGVDHLMSLSDEDPKLIVVGSEVMEQARTMFRTAQGRDPSEAEMAKMRSIWIDNEVLYREGLALGVDRGDDTIRERVIFKALNVVQANLRTPPLQAGTIEQWFAQHHARYDEPARIDFLEARFGDGQNQEQARAYAVALNRGDERSEAEGRLSVFKGRPLDSVALSFGREFADALVAAPQGEWVLLPSQGGPRVVRVDARTAAVEVPLESVRVKVQQDWEDEQMQRLRKAAIDDIASGYRIVDAGDRP